MKKIIITLLVYMMLTSSAFATTEVVDVTIPGFPVSINNYEVNNTSETYPFLIYNDIVYMPMTWDISRTLGLEVSWNKKLGLSISKGKNSYPHESGKEKVWSNTDKLKAKIIIDSIIIDGIEKSTKESSFPLLLFNDITYFPMTWDYMVDTLGFKLKYTTINGLELMTEAPKAKISKVALSQSDAKTMFKKVADALKNGTYNWEIVSYKLDYMIGATYGRGIGFDDELDTIGMEVYIYDFDNDLISDDKDAIEFYNTVKDRMGYYKVTFWGIPFDIYRAFDVMVVHMEIADSEHLVENKKIIYDIAKDLYESRENK